MRTIIEPAPNAIRESATDASAQNTAPSASTWRAGAPRRGSTNCGSTDA